MKDIVIPFILGVFLGYASLTPTMDETVFLSKLDEVFSRRQVRVGA